VGTINVVPAGFAGAGTAIVGDYVGGGWYSVASTLGPLTLEETTGGGPEGIAWVAAGAKDFASNSALLSLHMLGEVDACLVDSFGAPTGCQPFMTGLIGAEGAAIDPVTGDFLFTTFQAGNQIAVVSLNPEPAPAGLVGLGLLGLFCLGRRKHKARPAGGC
jgi:MYXO-CTERM domain-containing protein